MLIDMQMLFAKFPYLIGANEGRIGVNESSHSP